MNIFNLLFHYVLQTTIKYNIDESHGLSHSMNVLHNAQSIRNSLNPIYYPYLKDQDHIIYTSAVLHDMCDKKYMDVDEGIQNIENAISTSFDSNDIDTIKKIMNTMSYSKVKLNGFPDMGDFQMAYHIVREADLLAAYDFDRCMVYDMYKKGTNVDQAYEHAKNLFYNRVFKHHSDGLLITDYSQTQHFILKPLAHQRMRSWNQILKYSK